MKRALLFFSLIFWGIFNMNAQGGDVCANAQEAVIGSNFADHQGGSIDQWYVYTSTSDVIVNVSSCGQTGEDTYLEVFSGSCGGDLIAKVDDNCDYQSQFSFLAQKGISYFIKWRADYSPESYNWDLSTSSIETGQICEKPKIAQEGINYSNHSGGSVGQWFAYTLPEVGFVHISSCGMTEEDTYLYVYKGDCDGELVVSVDDNCGDLQSETYIEGKAGETYLIFWSVEYGPELYPWSLTFNNAPPEQGIDCSNPYVLVDGQGSYLQDRILIWGEYTAPEDSRVTLSTASDEYVFIFEDCNLEELVAEAMQSVSFFARANKSYKIAFYSYTISDNPGATPYNVNWNLNSEPAEIPPGLTCDDPIQAFDGMNTAEMRLRWYTYTPSSDGFIAIKWDDDYSMGVNLSETCDGGFDDPVRRDENRAIFSVEANQEYRIRVLVDGLDSGNANWELLLNENTACDISEASISEQYGPAEIDPENGTVLFTLLNSDAVDQFVSLDLSFGATAYVNNEEISHSYYHDFSTPLQVEVVSGDGSTSKNWVISAERNSAALSEKEVISLHFEGNSYPDQLEGIIGADKIEVPVYNFQMERNMDFDISHELSPGASSNLGNSVVLADAPISFDVIAEDQTTKTWTIETLIMEDPEGSSCFTPFQIAEGINEVDMVELNEVWYSYTPTADLVVQFQFDEYSFKEVEIQLYSDCNSFIENDYLSRNRLVQFVLEADQNYLFRMVDESYSNMIYDIDFSVAPLNSENDIEFFWIDNVESDDQEIISFDQENHSIEIEVDPSHDLSNSEIDFEVSSGATVFLNNSELYNYSIIDLTSPVVITVEAMDGTSQDWNINVSHRDLYTSNDIEAFLFNGQLGSSDININDGSVTANVSANEDLSSIAPYVLVSDGATVIVNGSQYENGSIVDFSSPVVFTVISEAGIQKAWTVTITQKTPVFDITISGNAAITTDGGTIQLSADVLPVDADNRNILWTVSTGATIDETGLLTAVQNGTVTVKAIAEDGSGVYREYVVTISGQITSINHPQQEAGSKVMVYPNPVSSVLYIDIEGDVGQEIEYKLINIKGDAVISQSMMNTGSTGEVNVDHLDNGIYFLVIKINDALIVKKVICN